jgi:hypothetical protein
VIPWVARKWIGKQQQVYIHGSGFQRLPILPPLPGPIQRLSRKRDLDVPTRSPLDDRAAGIGATVCDRSREGERAFKSYKYDRENEI